ncbi:MAG: FAD:protein FMN transferase [Betaproteobacteria bacterium]|nr:FAD:protein FMN transferase [Betaproteobacteria bacterium]
MQRAKPLLGTIVSIRADAGHDVIDEAFAGVALVHRLMSPEEPSSDISRINAEAHRQAVSVHPWTFRVLKSAGSMSRASGGAFDVTLRRHGATHADIVLDRGRVRLGRRAELDLGGIAKGFAVDRAVDVLRRRGATQGCVNAGGDLRLFGTHVEDVRVRLPSSPAHCIPVASASNRAFATSAGYFQDEAVDARTGERSCAGRSITVGAPTCMIADALTKAVAALGPIPALLRQFAAEAHLIDRHGRLHAAAG